MKILHIIDSLFVGGAETLLKNLCAVSVDAGNSVEVYVLRGGGALEADVRSVGVTVHIGGSGSVYSPLHILQLMRLMKSSPYDLIHVHLFPAQLWACLAARISGCKSALVTTEHSTNNRRRVSLFRPIDRWMFKQFASVVAISEATRTALAHHLKVDGQAFTVVSNGIDENQFKPRRLRCFSAKTPTLRVLMVGSLARVKDHATAIRALSFVDNVDLIIAGNGPLRNDLETLAEQLGVESRVKFLGERRDVPQLIADSDLFVQASRWEGFCLAAVEAMSGGLPCIVSRVDGLMEVVGRAALPFEPGDAKDLAAKITWLSEDPERRAQLSVLSLEQAKRFSIVACSQGYDAVYKTVASVS